MAEKVKFTPTKYINSQLSIYRREKPINEMNKPPCDIESDSYRQHDDTAKRRIVLQSSIKWRNINNSRCHKHLR